MDNIKLAKKPNKDNETDEEIVSFTECGYKKEESYQSNRSIRSLFLGNFDPLYGLMKLQILRKQQLNLIFKGDKRWKILCVLYSYNGKPVHLSRLAKILDIGKWNLTRNTSPWKHELKTLIENGMVKENHNKKLIEVWITETGKFAIDVLISNDIIYILDRC